MKNKAIMLTSLIIGLVNTATAQQFQGESDKSYHFGFKAGLNQSNLAGYNDEDISAKSGYQAGGFISTSILNEWLRLSNMEFQCVTKPERILRFYKKTIWQPHSQAKVSPHIEFADMLIHIFINFRLGVSITVFSC